MKFFLVLLIFLLAVGLTWRSSILAVERDALRVRARLLAFECPPRATCRDFGQGEVSIEVDGRRWMLIEVPK